MLILHSFRCETSNDGDVPNDIEVIVTEGESRTDDVGTESVGDCGSTEDGCGY